MTKEELRHIREIYFSTGIFHKSHNGNTALHLATQNNSLIILRKILESIQREEQRFPIFYQSENNNSDINESTSSTSSTTNNHNNKLKRAIDIQNEYGLTPLHFACIG